MNVYDSGRMADVLEPLGFACVDQPDDADMVILNTCHIREKASEKIYSDLGRLKKFKSRKSEMGAQMVIAVAGCVAQAEGQEILRRQPAVDMIFGPQSYHRLPDLLTQLEHQGGQVMDTDFPVEDKFDALPAGRASKGVSAFLSIQEGCDKFCTFCVVPYTRGAEFSRPVDQVVSEAKSLVQAGVHEITLLGQNVNAYHGRAPEGSGFEGTWSLSMLLEHLATLGGLERLRYTTSHPLDMDDGLIAAHASVPELMPYLHLPVQSGSDRILDAMNRQHTAKHYLKLVDEIRKARPDMALSSDFIVGFPGETRRDFEDTLKLIEQVHYAQAFSFKYSPRPGTPGAAVTDQVPEAEKAARLAELQDVLGRQQQAFNAACVGQSLDVLFEKPGRHEGQMVGRSPYLQAVHVRGGPDLTGRVAQVMVDHVEPNSLSGHLVVAADLADLNHSQAKIGLTGSSRAGLE